MKNIFIDNTIYFLAFWIAFKSIKLCLDHLEDFNYVPNGYSIDRVWEAIKAHFNIDKV